MGQAGISRLVFLQILVKIPEAGALPGLGVVAGQGVVQGSPPIGGEPLPYHHLNQTAKAADSLEQLLGVPLVDDEGVHALAGDAGGKDSSARSAGHVGILPFPGL